MSACIPVALAITNACSDLLRLDLEVPNSPYRHCGLPTAFTKDTWLLMLWTSAVWAIIIMPPWTWSCQTSPYMAPFTTKPVMTACSSVPLSQVKVFLSKVHPESLEEVTAPSNVQTGMPSYKWRSWRIRDTWHHKRNNKLPVTDHKRMEIYELLDKYFKIIALKILRELQENIAKQFNELRRTIYEQNKKFNK